MNNDLPPALIPARKETGIKESTLLGLMLRYLRMPRLRTQSATQSGDPGLRMNSLHARTASHARAVVLATFPRSPP